MIETIKTAFTTPEIRKKILMTLFMILVFRIGSFIPIPGLNPGAITDAAFGAEGAFTFFQLMNAVNGQALMQGTIFALGIMPFINAFIIMQLVTLVIPPLERLSKEGEEGRKKITQITRYLAIVLGILQAIGIIMMWDGLATAPGQDIIEPFILGMENTVIWSQIFIVITLVGGSAFVMWIGERITEYGIGNGTSLIIFIGILSTFASGIWNFGGVIQGVGTDMVALTELVITIIVFIVILLLIFFFIVYVDLAERRVAVQYAKQVKGNKMFGGQSTHIPMKVNASGVMPIIFASSFLMFPQMVMSMFGTTEAEIWWTQYFGADSWLYIFVMAALILFFTYFYNQIQFDPEDVARNIQQHGGFVPGIRPGKPTVEHLRKINTRITFFGAIFLMMVMLIPTLIFRIPAFERIGMNHAFTATGLLIIVSVALEFNKQLEAQLMMKHYKGFLK